MRDRGWLAARDVRGSASRVACDDRGLAAVAMPVSSRRIVSLGRGIASSF